MSLFRFKQWKLFGIACLWLLGASVMVGSAQDELTPTPTATPEFQCEEVPFSGLDAAAYYIGLGDTSFARLRYPNAADYYTCAITLQPDHVPTYVKRGYIYAVLGDTQRALADYERALALDELYIPLYVNRGVFYTRIGNFGLAINDLTLALSLDPNNVDALNNRAVIHAIEGNYDLALQDITAVLALDEQNALAYAIRAGVYSALAVQDYQTYVNVSSTPQLPAGAPNEVISAIDASLRTGDFSIWLSYLSAASGPAS